MVSESRNGNEMNVSGIAAQYPENVKIQNDEKLCIQSIFEMEDVICKTETAWKTWQPLELKIKLFPTQGMSKFGGDDDTPNNHTKIVGQENSKISIVLEVTCSFTYPNSVPTINLVKPCGIKPEDITKLKNELLELANSKLGSAMCDDLIQYVRAFLYKIKSPLPSNLHEGMLKTNAEKKKQIQRQRSISERREHLEIEEETLRRTEIENRRKEERKLEEKKKLEIKLKIEKMNGVGEGEIILCLDNEKRRFYKEKGDAEKGSYTGRKLSNYMKEFIVVDQTTHVLVNEWNFEWKDKKKTSVQNIKKSGNALSPSSPSINSSNEFKGFLQELDSFIHNAKAALRSSEKIDQSCYRYVFIDKQILISNPQHLSIRILVGQEIEKNDRPLSDVLQNPKDNLPSNTYIPRICCQSVCALTWLHSLKLAHGKLGLDSIWLSKKNTFKIGDYFVLGGLLKYGNQWDKIINSMNDGKTKFDFKNPIEGFNKNFEGAKIRQNDLVDLGNILRNNLKLFKEKNWVVSSLKDPEFENSLNDFIDTCLNKKSLIEDLVDHSFLNHNLITLPASCFPTATGKLLHYLTHIECERVKKEFIVSDYLGSGAFGIAIAAYNKVDGNTYALKIVPMMMSKSMHKKILSEAFIFSKIHNHPNLVKYHQAWISRSDSYHDYLKKNNLLDPTLKNESLDYKNCFKIDDVAEDSEDSEEYDPSFANPVNELSSSEDDDYNYVSYKNSKNKKKVFQRDTKFSISSDDGHRSKNDDLSSDEDDIMFESSPSENNEDRISMKSSFDHSFASKEFDKQKSVKNSQDNDGSDEEHSDCDEFEGYCEFSDEEHIVDEANEDLSKREVKLFIIQMEYCPNSTLRALIDSGNLSTNVNEIWRIFREIADGLSYLHNQGFIHRDIKPMNIFLSSGNKIKIGDFGLAAINVYGQRLKYRDDVTKDGSCLHLSNDKSNDLTKEIGTASYVAPELVSAVSNRSYTSKIDVYSTGIVLFEMFYTPLPQGMERVLKITAMRKREFPSDFGVDLAKHQIEAAKTIIDLMLQEDPANRPDIDEILHHDLLPKGHTENSFQMTLKEVLNSGEKTRFSGGVRFFKTPSKEEDGDDKLNILKSQKSLVENENPNNKSYVYKAIFETESSFARKFLFDEAICKSNFKNRDQRLIEYIKTKMVEILQLHAYEDFKSHTLLPEDAFAKKNNSQRDTTYKVVDRNGLLLTLPSDLRRNFVRICARSGIISKKRYDFGKVFYSQNELSGEHPIEKINLAIDVVNEISSAAANTAEFLYLISNLTKKIPMLSHLKCSIRIGDIRLFRVFCKHNGINNEQVINAIQKAFVDISVLTKPVSFEEKTKRISAAARGLQKNVILSFLKQLESCTNLETLRRNVMKFISRSQNAEVQEQATDVMKDFDAINKVLTVFCPPNTLDPAKMISITYDPSLLIKPEIYNSSLICLVTLDVPTNKGTRKMKQIHIAAGGRYDAYLQDQRQGKDKKTFDNPIFGLGCSVDISKIASIITNYMKVNEIPMPSASTYVAIRESHLYMEIFKLLGMLWKTGISATYSDKAIIMDAGLEYCRKNGIINFLFITDVDLVLHNILENLEHGKDTADLYSTVTKKMSFDDAVNDISYGREYSFDCLETISSSMTLSNIASSQGSTRRRVRSRNDSCNGERGADKIVSSVGLERNSNVQCGTPGNATFSSNTNITYACQEKLSHAAKKKAENWARNNLSDIVSNFSAKKMVTVILSDVSTDILRSIAINIDVNMAADHYDQIISDLLKEPGNSKYKNSVNAINIEMKKLLFSPHSFKNVIILCTTVDEKFYKVLI
uniref:Non-specific serine/threonine protein kinase n=1 Tax=Rhabditophanes sp. KR3021 TaxID=114890 RepID=A0AC35TNJ1_9BILA